MTTDASKARAQYDAMQTMGYEEGRARGFERYSEDLELFADLWARGQLTVEELEAIGMVYTETDCEAAERLGVWK